MIRRKISAGALRAAAQAQAAPQSAAAVPSSPSRRQAKGLASSVMMSSRNWKAEPLVNLKAELKTRGLSQIGNKSVLVDRLFSSDTSASLPPVPKIPSMFPTTPSKPRTFSTTAPVGRPPKRPAAKTSEQPSESVEESVTSTGPAVSAPALGAQNPAPLTKEEVTIAPGLPATKDIGGGSASQMSVQMPTPRDLNEPRQTIPLTPDNFRATVSEPEPEPRPEDELPKVLTVASASTHPAGGPSHASHEATDAHSLELETREKPHSETPATKKATVSHPETSHKAAETHSPKTQKAADTKAKSDTAPDSHSPETAVEEAVASLPSFISAISSVFSSPARAWKSSGMSAVVPEVGAPKGRRHGEYKKGNHDTLNAEEKRGAWVLGGIMVGGYLLGGLTKRSGSKDHGKHGESGGMGSIVAGSSGAKGDAEWEKASGAGVVGHGKRKA